jgi:hypothetical protein
MDILIYKEFYSSQVSQFWAAEELSVWNDCSNSSTHSHVQIIPTWSDARNAELVTDMQSHVSDVLDIAVQTDGHQYSGFVSQMTTNT